MYVGKTGKKEKKKKRKKDDHVIKLLISLLREEIKNLLPFKKKNPLSI